MLGPGDTLIVVDVQEDFLSGGSLGVPGSREILAPLNRVLAAFSSRGLPVFATRDWHPEGHRSFRERGGPWPRHCVAGTEGARFSSGLRLPPSAVIISKGLDPARDAYSGFDGTELEAVLRGLRARRLFIGGLALDYCVRATALDALGKGFAVTILQDAVRAAAPASSQRIFDELIRRGAGVGQAMEIEAAPWNPGSSALLTDLYELTMMQAYLREGLTGRASFELFVRRLPKGRNFMMTAGLSQALDYLEGLSFSTRELDWIADSGLFGDELIEYLARWRFEGDVDAIPEGTLAFADEPLCRVTASLPQAQFVETRLLNILNFQTTVASKAVRCVLAARGRRLVEFGLRRAQGAEAGLWAARAAYLAGFDASSATLAAPLFGIPPAGTMAHSFVQAHDDEAAAFKAFVRANPHSATLILDTYDVDEAALKAAELGSRLKREGLSLDGVRLDSGDMAAQSKRVRRVLDDAGLGDAKIFASGNLDEWAIRDLLVAGAPIDGFGVGTRLATSADAPYFDCAYKLEEYEGRPRRKRSEGKATWPGRKQVWRRMEGGRFAGDVVSLEGERVDGAPLLEPAMRAGRRLPQPTIEESRRRAAWELRALPDSLKSLDVSSPYLVRISEGLRRLAARLDAEHPQGKVVSLLSR